MKILLDRARIEPGFTSLGEHLKSLHLMYAVVNRIIISDETSMRSPLLISLAETGRRKRRLLQGLLHQVETEEANNIVQSFA